jgi:arginyl-tRNA synthetase
VSLKEFKRIYEILGVEFDSWNGESFYNDKINGVVDEIKEKNLLKVSQDAQIVDLEEYGMPPCIILRSDGASLYATRDLAAMYYRKNKYKFDKLLYVVGSAQNLHFKQVFKVIELLGHEWANDMKHVNFGMIRLENASMSTRKGVVVYLQDVLEESVKKAYDVIIKKNPQLENKEEVAEAVGIGAVIFSVFSNSRMKDTVFSWEKVLNFEGDTSPYIQYTYARISSIFRKIDKFEETKVNYSLLNDDVSLQLLYKIDNFQNTIKDAADKNEPHFIAKYAIETAQLFNKFYNTNRVIVEDEDVKNSRIMLCYAVKTVLKTSLDLLGIKCVEKM